MKSSYSSKYLLLAGLLMATAIGGRANLLQNPDFENVNPSVPGDWTNTSYSTAWNVPAGFHAYHENWAYYSLTNGGVFYAWSGADSPGGIYQDVNVAPGTYTFEIWVKYEQDANPTGATLKIEWLDATNGTVQAATVTNIEALIHDAQFHKKHVTGTSTSNNLHHVRVGLYIPFGTPTGGGGQAIDFDDAALYGGEYAYGDVPRNNSLEEGQSFSLDGSRWYRTSYVANHRPDWASHSGGNGGWALESYTGTSNDYSVTLSHRIYPTATGTYTFSSWIRRETESLLTNIVMTVRWYDESGSNEVLALVSNNFTSIPADGGWYQYYTTGDLTNSSCGEALLSIRADWGYNPSAGNRAAMVDDFTFMPGTPTSNFANIDYAYAAPSFEAVPGTTSLLTFLQINYDKSQTVFNILSDTNLSLIPEQTGTVWLKVTYQDPETLNYLDTWTEMSRAGQVTIQTNKPFHGLPTTSDKTLDLWTYTWRQPTNSSGVLSTNNIQTYFSPYIRLAQGVVEVYKYFYSPNPADNGRTNNYPKAPQYFATNFFGADYAYWNVPQPKFTALSNGNFEATAGQTGLTNTSWQFSRNVGRDTWAARGPDYGGYLPGWQVGHERLFQYVNTTTGTQTFSVWWLSEFGFNPIFTKVGLLWYNGSNQLIQRDDVNESTPSDKIWHHFYVSGTCTNPAVQYVVPYFESRFDAATGGVSGAVFYDDAQFYSGGYTGAPNLSNISFEDRVGQNNWRGAGGWMSEPESEGNTNAAERKDWAWYTGARGVALISYTSEGAIGGSKHQMNVSQVVTPGTGTYTFSSRFIREQNSQFTNTKLRLEWYDRSLTNQVQAPTETNFVIATNSTWTERYVTGTCLDTNLYEVRCVIDVQWDVNAVSPGPGEAAKIDDVHFNRGAYENHLNLEYAYHNALASNRFTEVTPGAYGTFVNVDYANTTTTFRVVAPQSISVRQEETAAAKMKITFQHPVTGNYLDVFTDMTLEGSAILTAGTPFHGLPASGSVTVNVWKYDWPMPRDAGQPPFTNVITVYYAPYLVATLSNSPSSAQQDLKYLTRTGSLANTFSDPQKFDDTFFDRDYAYTNLFITNVCSDCDLDGLPDWWELEVFGGTTNQASGDNDSDGFDNNAEFAARTDPNQVTSFFPRIVISTQAVGSVIFIRIPNSVTGRVYDAYWNTNLFDSASIWTPYGLNSNGNGGLLILTVPGNKTNRYIRSGAHP